MNPTSWVEDVAKRNKTDEGFIASCVDKLARNGCVVLRNYASSLEEMLSLTAVLPFSYLVHHGGEVGYRDFVGSDRTIATVNKGSVALEWHREAGNTPMVPGFIMFWCDIAPRPGTGHTLIVDGEQLCKGLTKTEYRILRGLSIRWRREYRRNDEKALKPLRAMFGMPEGADLQQAFDEVERDVPAGISLDVHVSESSVVATYSCSVLCFSRWTGRPAFCAHLMSLRRGIMGPPELVVPGGSTPADAHELLGEIEQRANELGYAHQWQAGDLMILDNARFMHARGTLDPSSPRRIITRIANGTSHYPLR